MPQYKNANAAAAGELEKLSAQQFKIGVDARDRFAAPRIIIAVIAAVLLVFSVFGTFTLPRT
jgi:hypothetical protein